MKTASNQKTTTEILADFTSYVFKHPAASATYRELMTAISAEASPRVIIFTGPTGVGKSTLLRSVGINAIAARTFGFCYASRARLPAMLIQSSRNFHT